MTPRELGAHAGLLKRDDERLASILSALHNGPMTRKDEQVWIPDMFLPGYVPEPPKPELLKIKGALDMALLKARQRRPTPEDFEAQKQIALRMQRAREASTAGASNEQITNIMRGIL
jgi:hypothetical protein